MRALLLALGASLATVVAIVLVVTLLAPAKKVTAAADRVPGGPMRSIEERVRTASNGQIDFRYDTWPDVWGDEHGNLNRQNQFHGEFDVDDLEGKEWRSKGRWMQGPMAVVLTLRDGAVTRLKFGIGEARWHHAIPTVDLGNVDGVDAARYLLDLAGTTTRDDLGEDAIVAAVFIRDGDIWDDLFQIARDSERPEEIRSSALFWLAQHDDPEVIDLFEELLAGD
jgi:hypothetical protein